MATATTALHSKLNQWRSDDASRAFEAGERREDVKSFLELTGWNRVALSMIARLNKMDEDKRQDVLRSFDEMRSEMQPVWDAGDTPDMFGHNSVQADDVLVDYSEPGNQVDDEDNPDQAADADGSVVPFGATKRA